MLSIFDDYELTDRPTTSVSYDPVKARRKSFKTAIERQIKLKQFADEGKTFTYQSTRGNMSPVAWWKSLPDGKVVVTLRYSNTILELKDNKYAVKLESIDKLVPFFERVRDAAETGAFDSKLEAVSNTRANNLRKAA